jgi:BirA family biotin operon repressor/biotin-[acetyl-CoA-carboxylase] ligase
VAPQRGHGPYGAGVDRAPLDTARLQAAAVPPWTRLEVVPETASTNADLLADSSAPDRAVRVAEHQTAGRGRLDRSWESPPRAGLTFSVLLRPAVPQAEWGWLPLLAGLAVVDAVRDTTGLAPALKWPNDVLLGPDERKVAGVLAQTSGATVVLGIGLNVGTAAAELPVETATSLALAGRPHVDRTDLLAAVLDRLDVRLRQWTDAAPDYRRACATLGRPVRVHLAGGAVVEGGAEDVDELGRLRVAGQVVTAGDVVHVRNA